MIETRQPRIESALETVETEIGTLRAEKRAWGDFLSRLVDINWTTRGVSANGGAVGGASVLAGLEGSTDQQLQRIRTAYRETIMAVSHYERDYDEPLAENMAAEIGTEIASHVTQGTVLVPGLSEAIRGAAKEAKSERSRFLKLLCDERESLTRNERRLNKYERQAVQLKEELQDLPKEARAAEINDNLEELEGKCSALAEARQETIHGRAVPSLSGVSGQTLTQYLYGGWETNCPVLTDALDCIETIRQYRVNCHANSASL